MRNQFLFAVCTLLYRTMYLFSIPLEMSAIIVKYLVCSRILLPHSQRRINMIAGVCVRVCTASDSRWRSTTYNIYFITRSFKCAVRSYGSTSKTKTKQKSAATKISLSLLLGCRNHHMAVYRRINDTYITRGDQTSHRDKYFVARGHLRDDRKIKNLSNSSVTSFFSFLSPSFTQNKIFPVFIFI